MEQPNKRLKTMSPAFEAQADFVSLGHQNAPSGPRAQRPHWNYNDRRNKEDKPHSKHVLPGYEPWVLVKTKFRRRFVHNTETKESFWRIPPNVLPGVVAFDQWEENCKEKDANAKWAEDQLQQMRKESKAQSVNQAADAEGRRRRRRSESLQREDEAAMMAELAAQAEHGEEQDARQAALAVSGVQPKLAYDSEGSYEEIEVTDSEFDEEDDAPAAAYEARTGEDDEVGDDGEDAPVEFGEDDIAFQLAAMGQDHGLDRGEYGEPDEEWEEGDEGLPLSEQDAVNLFRDLLDDYRISPFTPWENIIADESESSILNDDRYTVLPNMRARKEVWDVWTRDKAAQIKLERLNMEKLDPKIPYLAFLAAKATPKLYWPEFKRKYKREPELNDRKLSDKDREKLYRDHINRLKLPESTRKADFISLLKRTPLKLLNKDTRAEALPQEVVSHLHYISLDTETRNRIAESHIRTLPVAPPADDLSDEQRAEEVKRQEERRRREQAMAERERRVEDERRNAERDEARARRDLRDEERELQRAMALGNRGLQTQLQGQAAEPMAID